MVASTVYFVGLGSCGGFLVKEKALFLEAAGGVSCVLDGSMYSSC